MTQTIIINGEPLEVDDRAVMILRALTAPRVRARLGATPAGEVTVRWHHRTVKHVTVTETFGGDRRPD